MVEFGILRVENFCCLSRVEVDLADQGLTQIVGDNRDTDAASNNGSGKSTIPKALTWCLYGETLDGDRHDEVIRHGQEQASVSICFRIGRVAWEIERTRKVGKPSLVLHCDGRLWGGDAKATQIKIIDLLGLDFRGFCNVVLYGQGDHGRFLSSTDSIQKDTLHRVLRTDFYRRAEKLMREKVAAIRPQYEATKAAAGVTAAKLAEYDLDSIRRHQAEWAQENEREAKAQSKRAEDSKQEAGICRVERLAELGALRKKLKALEQEQKGLVALAGGNDPSVLAQREIEARDSIETHQAACSEQNSMIRQADEMLGRLDADLCPVCTSPLDKGAPAKFIKEWQAKRERMIPQRDASVKALELARAKRVRLAEEMAEAARVARKLHDLNVELTRLRERDAQFAERIEQEMKHLQDKQRDAEQQVLAIRARRCPYDEQLRAAIRRHEELREESLSLDTLLKEQELEIAHHEFWVRGFGARGLPSLLLDSTMPFLSERTNHYLETLTDGDITVAFSTQRELKTSGDMKDEISVAWTIEGVPGVKPSNGQRQKMEIASNFALGDLASTREDMGAGMSLLFLDEVLDGLDGEGVSRVLRLLRTLRASRSSIFVITHEASLAEAFERTLRVTKRGGASTVDASEAA